MEGGCRLVDETDLRVRRAGDGHLLWLAAGDGPGHASACRDGPLRGDCDLRLWAAMFARSDTLGPETWSCECATRRP